MIKLHDKVRVLEQSEHTPEVGTIGTVVEATPYDGWFVEFDSDPSIFWFFTNDELEAMKHV